MPLFRLLSLAFVPFVDFRPATCLIDRGEIWHYKVRFIAPNCTSIGA